MQPETKDTLMGDIRGIAWSMKPGAYIAAFFFAVAGANYIMNNPDNTAQAEPKAEQPAPPSNYAVNQFILK